MWSGGCTIGTLAGQVVRLELELLNGRLYALRRDLRSAFPAGQRRSIDTRNAAVTRQKA